MRRVLLPLSPAVVVEEEEEEVVGVGDEVREVREVGVATREGEEGVTPLRMVCFWLGVENDLRVEGGSEESGSGEWSEKGL